MSHISTPVELVNIPRSQGLLLQDTWGYKWCNLLLTPPPNDTCTPKEVRDRERVKKETVLDVAYYNFTNYEKTPADLQTYKGVMLDAIHVTTYKDVEWAKIRGVNGISVLASLPTLVFSWSFRRRFPRYDFTNYEQKPASVQIHMKGVIMDALHVEKHMDIE